MQHRKYHFSPAHRAIYRKRGLTLLEVMVGFALASIALTGMFTVLIQSYRLTLHTRYLDEARNVLRSVAEQVMQPNASSALFQATAGPTGTGLSWDGSDGRATGLPVIIGASSNLPITALVFREVTDLNETTAAPEASSANGVAGRLVQCRLTINFTQGNRLTENSLILIRSVP